MELIHPRGRLRDLLREVGAEPLDHCLAVDGIWGLRELQGAEVLLPHIPRDGVLKCSQEGAPGR